MGGVIWSPKRAEGFASPESFLCMKAALLLLQMLRELDRSISKELRKGEQPKQEEVLMREACIMGGAMSCGAGLTLTAVFCFPSQCGSGCLHTHGPTDPGDAGVPGGHEEKPKPLSHQSSCSASLCFKSSVIKWLFISILNLTPPQQHTGTLSASESRSLGFLGFPWMHHFLHSWR